MIIVIDVVVVVGRSCCCCTPISLFRRLLQAESFGFVLYHTRYHTLLLWYRKYVVCTRVGSVAVAGGRWCCRCRWDCRCPWCCCFPAPMQWTKLLNTVAHPQHSTIMYSYVHRYSLCSTKFWLVPRRTDCSTKIWLV